ncbi:MAG: TonB-dependent receptor, partial [Flavobacteriales bacterium CG_4_10_14_0_2_um_filter_35_18]
RYSLNSIKHQVITTFNAKFFEHFFHSITTKFVERPNGTHYSVVDSRLNIEIQQVSLSLMANNIFNANYTETSLVPMPKANFLMRMAYTFK